MLPRAVSDHYRAQQRLIVATLGLTRGEWSAMDLDNLDASWAKVAPRINLLTASAQLGAATNGARYVGAVLDEYGEDIGALGSVNPRAFAGIASDGRPLGSLLDGAVVRAKATNSLEVGGRWLDMAVHTQVADAGRGAASVAIATRPGVGWVRMVNPPSCGPCAVLAGKEFRYNQGFERHPRCDCVHVPTTLANPFDHDGVSPTLDQITDLTEGERKALLEGSDLSRVINARRGGGLGKMSTTELAKRGQVRLTPDGIFATARSRDEALALLNAHGYVTPTARRVAATATRPTLAAPVRVAKPALDLSRIQAAKTPTQVADELQRLMGARGTVTGFDHPTIGLDKAKKVAEQIARLSDKHPRVRFDTVVAEVKNKMTLAHASWKPGADGVPDSFTLTMSRSKMTARSKTDDMLKNSADANHWRVSPETDTDAMTYVVTHEFGHLIDFTTGNYHRGKFGTSQMRPGELDAVSAMRTVRELAKADGLVEPEPYFLWRSPKADPVKVQEYHDWNAFVDSQVSKYGRTNAAEGIAEAFADVEINGDHASASNKLTVSRLLRLLEEMA